MYLYEAMYSYKWNEHLLFELWIAFLLISEGCTSAFNMLSSDLKFDLC